MTNWYLCQDFHLQIQVFWIYIYSSYIEKDKEEDYHGRIGLENEDNMKTNLPHFLMTVSFKHPPVPTGTQFCVHCFICCIQGHPCCLTLVPRDISPSTITEETGAWESHHDARRLKQLKTWGFHDYRNPLRFSLWMTAVKTSLTWPSVWKNHSAYFHHKRDSPELKPS